MKVHTQNGDMIMHFFKENVFEAWLSLGCKSVKAHIEHYCSYLALIDV